MMQRRVLRTKNIMGNCVEGEMWVAEIIPRCAASNRRRRVKCLSLTHHLVRTLGTHLGGVIGLRVHGPVDSGP